MSHDHPKKPPIDPEIVRPDAPHPDEVIHVPKGSSKTRFLLTFLIVVLVLTTFTVTEPLMDVLGGKDRSFNSYMTWKTAGGESRSVSNREFADDKRAYGLIQGMFNPQSRRDLPDEEVASFIVLDQAAEEAGIRTPDSQVAKVIQGRFATSNDYNETLRRFRTTNKDTEAMIRRMLRVNRYADLQKQAFAVPDPKAIETSWKGQHQEYTFDYTELPVATVVEEARAQAPKGDELKAWFDALPDHEKEAYKTKPEVSAELAGFSLEGPWAADAILAKYPRPADVDAEKAARDYAGGAGFGYIRFPKVPTTRGDTNFQPFEDVKDQALREAPVYAALTDWVADLKKREAAGETIDLAAEASALGLSYRKQVDPQNRDAWKDLGIPFVGRRTIETLFEPVVEVGKLMLAIQVDEKAFVYGRQLESRPARVPDFAEIEERVRNAWADKKAREIATARLEAIRGTFGTPPDPADATAPPFVPEADEARFAEAVKSAGLTLQRRDWQERMTAPTPEDPPGDVYIRSTPSLYTHKVSTVVTPGLNRDGTVAYLVRVGGVRDPDLSKLKVEELQQLAQNQARQDQMQFTMKMQTREFLENRYGLDLESWHPENQRPPE